MSEMSIDVADAMQAYLNDCGYDASAWPLPDDFDERLPFTRVTALGGSRRRRVLDTFRLQLETWASTPAEAMAEALRVEALVCDLEGATLGGVTCYAADVVTKPHDARDPYHPDLANVEALAQITVRTAHV